MQCDVFETHKIIRVGENTETNGSNAIRCEVYIGERIETVKDTVLKFGDAVVSCRQRL